MENIKKPVPQFKEYKNELKKVIPYEEKTWVEMNQNEREACHAIPYREKNWR